MTDGLITRVGKWVDNKWESKATETDLLKLRAEIESNAFNLRAAIENLVKTLPDEEEYIKEVADLKTRLEKIELYSGMTRKVDPTKPPIVKSAFQM